MEIRRVKGLCFAAFGLTASACANLSELQVVRFPEETTQRFREFARTICADDPKYLAMAENHAEHPPVLFLSTHGVQILKEECHITAISVELPHDERAQMLMKSETVIPYAAYSSSLIEDYFQGYTAYGAGNSVTIAQQEIEERYRLIMSARNNGIAFHQHDNQEQEFHTSRSQEYELFLYGLEFPERDAFLNGLSEFIKEIDDVNFNSDSNGLKNMKPEYEKRYQELTGQAYNPITLRERLTHFIIETSLIKHRLDDTHRAQKIKNDLEGHVTLLFGGELHYLPHNSKGMDEQLGKEKTTIFRIFETCAKAKASAIPEDGLLPNTNYLYDVQNYMGTKWERPKDFIMQANCK